MITGKPGEWYEDGVIGGYFAEDGHLVVCVEFNLSDKDTDRYFVQVQNGEGYYDENGKYTSYNKE